MSVRGWRVAGVALGLAFTFALAALSRVPYSIEPGDDALIRLSWRTATAFVEECRTVSPEELERMPVHMRREQICEGRLLPYRLEVELDGETVINNWVHGAGARQDRPLSVFQEIRVRPGAHHVRVRWIPDVRPGIGDATGDDASAASARANAESATPQRARNEQEVPPALELETTLRLEPRDVALFTYDGTHRRLIVLGAEAN
jgi:hypothetical protein